MNRRLSGRSKRERHCPLAHPLQTSPHKPPPYESLSVHQSENQEHSPQTAQMNHSGKGSLDNRKVKVKVLLAQSCPTLCDPMDCSPQVPSVPGILQARILEWVTMLSSKGSSQPRDRTQVSYNAGRFFTRWAANRKNCFRVKKLGLRDLPGGPVAKTLCSPCRGPRGYPCSGN